MNAAVEEWVAKAEGDFRVAQREWNVADSPNYDAVSFHAQQCAEKYIKAYLVQEKRTFPKTHDLELLLNMILDLQPGWEQYRTVLVSLTDVAVEVRYPGLTSTAEMAEHCLKTAELVRTVIRTVLGIP